MDTIMKKDPYQLVCQAFERNEIQELLLGERGYGYKIDNPRGDFTYPEEKTDLISLDKNLTRYYVTNGQNAQITQKIFDALMKLPETPWGITVLSRAINHEMVNRKNKHPNLNLDLDRLAQHLKEIITRKRVELMQEKLFGGNSWIYGKYQSLIIGSNLSVEKGGPAYVDENDNANDAFEANTSFTLTLPGKIANLDSRLNLIPLRPIRTALKGTPIPSGNGYIAAPDSTWTFTIEKDKQPTAENQFICMVNELYVRKIKLLKLIEDFGLKTQLDAIIWMHQPNQKIVIPLNTLEKIKELNIPFSIEIRLKEF